MRLLKTVVCLGMMAMVVSVASADEKQEKKGKGKQKSAPSATQRYTEKLELTAAQKELVAAIDKEFAPAMAELNKKRSDILTDEQKKAQQVASKAAKAAGKTAAESRKAADTALNLNDEQKEKMKVVQKSQQEFNAKVIAALKKVLTPEQIEKLPKTDGAKGKDKKKKKDA